MGPDRYGYRFPWRKLSAGPFLDSAAACVTLPGSVLHDSHAKSNPPYQDPLSKTVSRVRWVPRVGHAEGSLETRPPLASATWQPARASVTVLQQRSTTQARLLVVTA